MSLRAMSNGPTCNLHLDLDLDLVHPTCGTSTPNESQYPQDGISLNSSSPSLSPPPQAFINRASATRIKVAAKQLPTFSFLDSRASFLPSCPVLGQV
jgi:hypothetical protein